MIGPLAIVQARIGSTRLPRKMLLDLGGRPLIWWAWNAAVEAFGYRNVVVAMPASAENDELAEAVLGFRTVGQHDPQMFRWDGPENDVLTRLSVCAHRYRWHPDSVIVRVTPDDPFKNPLTMRLVAEGERHPVEIGAEAFTLGMLDRAHRKAGPLFDSNEMYVSTREHIGNNRWLFPTPPPPPPPGIWTVDTQEDLDRARERIGQRGLATGQIAAIHKEAMAEWDKKYLGQEYPSAGRQFGGWPWGFG